MKPLAKIAISIAIPLAGGIASAVVTSSSLNSWYNSLVKPSFNPPGWLFGPVWTVLYVLMGIAFYLVWSSSITGTLKKQALGVYFIQLLLNFLWSFLFFGANKIGAALTDIFILLAMIVATIFFFNRISRTAAVIMIPYLLWVCFATVLNFAIWQLN